MSNATPLYGFRYPVGPASVNVPGDMKNLADDLEAWIRKYEAAYLDLRASAVTSIAHNQATYVKVALATTTHADTTYFTVSSSVVTIVETGSYDIGVTSGFAAPGSPTAESEFAISLNGLAFANRIARWKSGAAVGSASENGLSLLQYPLAAGDTIQIGAFQFRSSGSTALNTSADSRLMIRRRPS